jgi:hypothetical protein
MQSYAQYAYSAHRTFFLVALGQMAYGLMVTIVIFWSVSASELKSKPKHWTSNDVNEDFKVAAFVTCYPYSGVGTLMGLSRVHNEV